MLLERGCTFLRLTPYNLSHDNTTHLWYQNLSFDLRKRLYTLFFMERDFRIPVGIQSFLFSLAFLFDTLLHGACWFIVDSILFWKCSKHSSRLLFLWFLGRRSFDIYQIYTFFIKISLVSFQLRFWLNFANCIIYKHKVGHMIRNSCE